MPAATSGPGFSPANGNPLDRLRLLGYWSTMIVQVPLPSDQVQRMLPPGLVLVPQANAEPGTHIVRFSFGINLQATMSFPAGFYMDYDELAIGISDVTRITSWATYEEPELFYYMPRLFLNNFWATSGGVTWWGFEKRMGQIQVQRVGEDIHYRVHGEMGEPLISARWALPPGRPEIPVLQDHEHFHEQQRVWDQPLISRLPFGEGPWFGVSTFQMQWPAATVIDVQPEIEINDEFIPGMPVGTLSSDAISADAMGAYLMYSPWQLSLVHTIADLPQTAHPATFA